MEISEKGENINFLYRGGVDVKRGGPQTNQRFSSNGRW